MKLNFIAIAALSTLAILPGCGEAEEETGSVGVSKDQGSGGNVVDDSPAAGGGDTPDARVETERSEAVDEPDAAKAAEETNAAKAPEITEPTGREEEVANSTPAESQTEAHLKSGEPTQGDSSTHLMVLLSSAIVTLAVVGVWVSLRGTRRQVEEARRHVTNVIATTSGEENTKIYLLDPFKKELEKLDERHENTKDVIEQIKSHIIKSNNAINEAFHKNEESVNNFKVSLDNVKKLSDERLAEVELYRKGMQLSAVKSMTKCLHQGLDYLEPRKATLADGGEVDTLEVIEYVEAIISQAFESVGVESFGEELIGRSITDHHAECEVVEWRGATSQTSSPGMIVAVVSAGQRCLIKDGEYLTIRQARVVATKAVGDVDAPTEESAPKSANESESKEDSNS